MPIHRRWTEWLKHPRKIPESEDEILAVEVVTEAIEEYREVVAEHLTAIESILQRDREARGILGGSDRNSPYNE